MILIISGPPGAGKTCLLTYIACMRAFDRRRNRQMQLEILNKQSNGFSEISTIPDHTVSANYDIRLKKFGYMARQSRRINPFRLGYRNPDVKTHFNIPYESIFITEAQKYLNSRMSSSYPDWQSRWYEQHRHNNLDIFLDVQRPMLIDVNIRELSQFIDVVKLDVKYNECNQPSRLRWTVRYIENNGLLEKYLASGKTDKSCYAEKKIVADFNVFACYDSQNCKPKFYDGHIGKDFDYVVFPTLEESAESYIRYLKEFDDEMPQNFYKQKGAKKK